jgi:hypothetical protein
MSGRTLQGLASMPGHRVRRQLLGLMTGLQKRARRHRLLVQIVRSVRNLLHFGPWRPIALSYVRWKSPPRDEVADRPSTLTSTIEPAVAVDALERDGYYLGARVCSDLLDQAAGFWRDKGPGVYIDVHLQSEALARVANDIQLASIARAYFGSEPRMIECKLFISGINQEDELTTGFHFDHAGVRSLNVMVYLTPVDEDAGPHVLVSGSHRDKRLGDYLRELTPVSEIERRFSTRVRVITGPAGSVLLENAEVFHRRLVAKKPRVAMIAVFSTNSRRVLSRGKDVRRGAAPRRSR